MINLLPPAARQEYQYARRNVRLRRWASACLVAMVGLGLLLTFGLLTMQQSSKNLQQQIASNQTLFTQENYTQTQKQVQDITTSFKLVVKVLGQEVLFSQVIKQIGSIIPAKAKLAGLTINQSQTAIDITAVAPDYTTASQVQVNLAAPNNKIFSSADLESITCNAVNTTGSSDYDPCTVTIRALFANNSPYLFINNSPVKP
jgi:Tfp pilus assembly protein PilN